MPKTPLVAISSTRELKLGLDLNNIKKPTLYVGTSEIIQMNKHYDETSGFELEDNIVNFGKCRKR